MSGGGLRKKGNYYHATGVFWEGSLGFAQESLSSIVGKD